jgi:clan AA aspartic protease
MSLSDAKLTLFNPVRPPPPVTCSALADTGAVYLCIPAPVALQLGLTMLEQRHVTLADRSTRHIPYVGPVNLRFANRQCCVGALVMGDEVLLGAIPMEARDPVVIPARREVTVNPASPTIPSSLAKGLYRPRRA